MKILVINAGSSSLKYQLFDMTAHKAIAKGICERIGLDDSVLKHQSENKEQVILKKDMPNHKLAIEYVLEELLDPEYGVISSMHDINAVGHRIVHGGEMFSDSVIIDEGVKQSIKDCIDLAPLHNPPNLTGVIACEEAMPGIPQVGVFDTAFHQTMPPEAFLYAIPYDLYEKYKIRKYGFHGTSHKYVAGQAAKILNRPLEELKLVVCHLGNGSSVCAVKDGKSVDTSMGLTPLAGVIMGTRSGDIDPAISTFIMEKEKLSAADLNDILNKKSGVLGISGVSSDFRDLESAACQGHKRAQTALDMFIYSIKKNIGAYAAIMGGLDAIVFTAGIGENNSSMRKKILDGLCFMGVKIDDEKNNMRGIDVDISAQDAKVHALVIPTNEELMIAIETHNLTENK